MVLSEEKKRVAFSLTDDDIRKMKTIYHNDLKKSDERIYESDTLSKMINAIYEMDKRGKFEWRS